jgi:ribonuclease Y
LERETPEVAADRGELEQLDTEASRTSDELVEHASGAEAAAEQELVAERKRLEALRSELRAYEQSVAMREAAVLASDREHEGGPDVIGTAHREPELRALAERLAAREADIVRMQTALAAREEELRRRERELDDAERMRERAAAIPLQSHVSFAEGLESLASRSERRRH